MPRKLTPVEDRFWHRLVEDPATGCWNWPGAKDPQGYGYIGAGRKPSSPHHTHRLAYQLVIGGIPSGLEIDHLCRNHSCCNPAHLEAVTHIENVRRGPKPPRTHCPQGHAYAGDNLFLTVKGGYQVCRTCRRDAKRRFDARSRSANK